MELQNDSIHGKKLRNTASRSTKHCKNSGLSDLLLLCFFFLLLLAVPVLDFFPSIAALEIFCCPVFVRILTCGLPVSDRALNAPLHPPHQDQQKDTSNRYHSYFPTFKASRLRRRACDDGETTVSHQTHQI